MAYTHFLNVLNIEQLASLLTVHTDGLLCLRQHTRCEGKEHQ